MNNPAKIRAMLDSAKNTYRESKDDCCYLCYWFRPPDRCHLRDDAEPIGLCDEFATHDEVVPDEDEVADAS